MKYEYANIFSANVHDTYCRATPTTMTWHRTPLIEFSCIIKLHLPC